jgi:hypothetical protein
MDSLTWLS